MSTRLTFRDGKQSAAVGMPDEGVGGGEIGARPRRAGPAARARRRSARAAPKRRRRREGKRTSDDPMGGLAARLTQSSAKLQGVAHGRATQLERRPVVRLRRGAFAPAFRRRGLRESGTPVGRRRGSRAPVCATSRHRLHLGDALFEVVEMGAGDLLDFAARPLACRAKARAAWRSRRSKSRAFAPGERTEVRGFRARRSRGNRSAAARPGAAGRSPRSGGSFWR